jgi:hypothetical protein
MMRTRIKGPSLRRSAASPPVRGRTPPLRRRRGGPLFFLLLPLLAGCVNVSMLCPDGKSTVTYKGVSLTGNTAVSCIGSPLGGDTVQVSGIDIAALALAVAPLLAAPAPPPPPPPAKGNSGANL